MYKKRIVAVCVMIVILFSGCAMNEKTKEMGKSEALIVEQWLFGMPDAKIRNLVFDEELIKEVNELFAQVDWQEDDEELVKEVNEVSSQFRWDWQDDDERSRPLPHYQIANYEVWLIDEFVHAIDIGKDRYAKLTVEDSEFILKFLIGIGMAH